MPDAPDILLSALKRLIERRETLSRADARLLMDGLLESALSETRVAALLGALAARGETTDELAGFVQSLRAHAMPIPLEPHERALLVDTCGTGGDLSGTFNISTAAALVAAAAGAWVAKHGNRAVTSACGSADVLEALGIPVDHTPESAAKSLRRHRFAFLPAPALQPAMKAVMPIRRALGVRTAFNILGPMSNPAGAPSQVMGVYAAHLVPIVAHTLARLQTRHAFVVHGSYSTATGETAGMDELSISGPTTVAEVKGGNLKFSTLHPEEVGVTAAPIQSLAGGDAQTNAAILRAVFAGERGPRRDVVVLNAAAVLVTANLAQDIPAGMRLAQDTIDSSKVTQLVRSLGAAPDSPSF
jgi:anthranilate phosphoribosyltransferase